jgi:4'-phosphopantetheinyl transferase
VLALDEGALPADDEWLSAEERTTLASLSRPKRRAEWRLGRLALKRLLAAGAATGQSLDAIVIRAAMDGAPEVFVGARPLPVIVSLSHRAGRALAACTPAPAMLGCDVELVEPRSDAFVRDYLTEAERQLVERADASDRPLLANLVWSAKESALKALRTGLRLDTRAVEIALEWPVPAGTFHPLAARHDTLTMAGWWWSEDGYVHTMVADP